MSSRTPPARLPFDVVALIFGVVLTGVAAVALRLSLAGSLNWSLLKTAAPLGLVAVGVVGLILSRRAP